MEEDIAERTIQGIILIAEIEISIVDLLLSPWILGAHLILLLLLLLILIMNQETHIPLLHMVLDEIILLILRTHQGIMIIIDGEVMIQEMSLLRLHHLRIYHPLQE